MTDLTVFYTTSIEKNCPLELISCDELAKKSEVFTDYERNLFAVQQFKGKAGDVCFLYDAQGKLAKVLVGMEQGKAIPVVKGKEGYPFPPPALDDPGKNILFCPVSRDRRIKTRCDTERLRHQKIFGGIHGIPVRNKGAHQGH